MHVAYTFAPHCAGRLARFWEPFTSQQIQTALNHGAPFWLVRHVLFQSSDGSTAEPSPRSAESFLPIAIRCPPPALVNLPAPGQLTFLDWGRALSFWPRFSNASEQLQVVGTVILPRSPWSVIVCLVKLQPHLFLWPGLSSSIPSIPRSSLKPPDGYLRCLTLLS